MATARSILRFTTLALSAAAIGGGLTLYNYRPYSPIITPVEAVAGTLTLDGSTSGSASFAGNITGASLIDANNNTYYVDPNGATSALFSGKVGIGVTSPGYELSVEGATSPSIQVADTTSGTGASNGMVMQMVDAKGYIWNYENDTLQFGANNQTKMTIEPGGDVGIGTTNPAYLLEVNGTQRVNGALTIGDASGDTVTSNAASWTLANDTNFVLSGGTNGISFDTSTLSVDATNDRVGVGITSPSGKLDTDSAATNDGYYLDGKAAVTGESADNWLRLNQNSSWTNGVVSPLLIRADGGFQVDGTTAIDASNNMHYAYLSGTYDKFGKVNSSGFGIDSNNSGNWDLLVYNGGQLYYNDVYMGYGGSATIRTYDTNESLSIIPNGSGNVYIASPLGGAKLDVNGDFRVEAANFQIKIFDTDTTTDEWAISTYNNQSLALFENGSGGTARFIFNTGANATAQADGVWTDNAFDLAEDYPISTGQSVEEGDLISISKHETERVGKSISRYDPNLMGVVSYHPAQLSGAFGTHPDGYVPGYKPIALVGRVPTKVTSENGSIKRGDPITSSSISGVGMKATRAGQIVGRALEPYDNNDPTKVGKIIVFVEPMLYDPDMIDGENSQIQLLQHKIDSQEKQLANFQTQIDELKKLIHEK